MLCYTMHPADLPQQLMRNIALHVIYELLLGYRVGRPSWDLYTVCF